MVALLVVIEVRVKVVVMELHTVTAAFSLLDDDGLSNSGSLSSTSVNDSAIE